MSAILKLALCFALALPAWSSAAKAVRCGTDAFGNIACLDKDGVLTTLSKDAANDYKAQAASGVSADGKRIEAGQKPRCGTDPFGNKVCR